MKAHVWHASFDLVTPATLSAFKIIPGCALIAAFLGAFKATFEDLVAENAAISIKIVILLALVASKAVTTLLARLPKTKLAVHAYWQVLALVEPDFTVPQLSSI